MFSDDDLARRFSRLPDFLELRTTYGPTRKISNAFIDWRPRTRKILLSRLNAAGSFLKGGDRPVGLSQNRPGDFWGVEVQDPAWSVHGFRRGKELSKIERFATGGVHADPIPVPAHPSDALLSSDEFGSSVDRKPRLHPLWQGRLGWGTRRWRGPSE